MNKTINIILGIIGSLLIAINILNNINIISLEGFIGTFGIVIGVMFTIPMILDKHKEYHHKNILRK